MEPQANGVVANFAAKLTFNGVGRGSGEVESPQDNNPNAAANRQEERNQLLAMNELARTLINLAFPSQSLA